MNQIDKINAQTEVIKSVSRDLEMLGKRPYHTDIEVLATRIRTEQFGRQRLVELLKGLCDVAEKQGYMQAIESQIAAQLNKTPEVE